MKMEVKLLKEVCLTNTEHCIKILEVKGYLDRNSIEEFKNSVWPYFSSNANKVVLDFQQVEFCDSSGLTGLIELTNKAQELNGFLRLVAVSDKVKQVILMLGLQAIISLFDTIDSAIAQ